MSDEKNEIAVIFMCIGALLVWIHTIGIAQSLNKLYINFQWVKLNGESEASVLAGMISQSLVPWALTGIIATVGYIILFIALVFLKQRRKWMLYLSILSAFIYSVFIPIGTLAAIILLVYLYIKRRSFYSA